MLCLLARRLCENGFSVLLSTTTKLASPDCHPYPANKFFFDDAVLSYRPSRGEGVFYARRGENGKVAAPPLAHFKKLEGVYDYLLLEADGSRQLPLKYHSERDPVVPEGAYVVAVAGLSSLYKSIASVCHGLKEREEVVDESFLQWLIDSPDGALKGGARLLVFNQAEHVPLPLPLSCPVPLLYASVRDDLLLRRV